MNIQEVMNYLFQRKAPNLPASALAEVFDRLIWCLDDNGHEILDEREAWLESDYPEKIEIALIMNEVYPYKSLEEMKHKFEKIVSKRPEFEEKCKEIINQRKSESL